MAHSKTPSQRPAWSAPKLRRIGTIRDIAFQSIEGQQGNSQYGNNSRS